MFKQEIIESYNTYYYKKFITGIYTNLFIHNEDNTNIYLTLKFNKDTLFKNKQVNPRYIIQCKISYHIYKIYELRGIKNKLLTMINISYTKTYIILKLFVCYIHFLKL